LDRPRPPSEAQASGNGPEDAVWPDDAVEVGRVVDAWGVKGEFKVQPFSADAQALEACRLWFVQPPQEAAAPPGARAWPTSLRLLAVRRHGEGLVARAHGIADRTTAVALRGARLFVSRAAFPRTGKDEYYWVDLIGLDVVNRRGEALGTVVGLIDTGPHSVLRVQPASPPAEEVLIPFVSAYVDAVEPTQRRITVDWGVED
jgi:16S rRNA processing protein RimM